MAERLVNVSHKEDNEELVYNGITFRSHLELYTAQALDKLGIKYEYEPRVITLLEGFRCPFQKDKVRGITYKPDFILNSTIIIECKGFETPEWKNKKKYIYKYLMENEPGVCFYQTHDSGKSLLSALDDNFAYLGFMVEVTSKPSKKSEAIKRLYNSVKDATKDLGLSGKPLGAIMSCLLGRKEYAFDYNFKLTKIEK